jgi:RNA polymerase sigma factor (sigma-70 family)
MAQQANTANVLTRVEDEIRAEALARKGLGELYRRYAGWLTAALRRRYGARAEDLVQETYIRIAPYQAAGEIRHPQALLMRIACNLARNQLRADANGERFARLLEEDGHSVGRAVAPDQHQALLFKQVVLDLPPIFRDVMILSRFTGLTNQEIALRLGVAVKTVEWRLAKAVALCVQRTQA